MSNSLLHEKWGVIANPIAGKRKQKNLLQQLEALLKSNGITFEIHLTQYQRHATEIAEKCHHAGCKVLLVVGGDGTLNEVVNGVCRVCGEQYSDITLALLPCGTGNDWARYWGMPRALAGFMQMILKGETKRTDLAKVTASNLTDIHYYINGLGIGYDAIVLKKTNWLKTIFGGWAWTYKFAVVLTLLEARGKQMVISAHEVSHVDKFLTIAVGNGCYSGGGLKQVAGADPTDGRLHVMALKSLTPSTIFSIVKALFDGTLIEHPSVVHLVSKRVDFQIETPVYAEADGILLGMHDSYTIEILPQRVNFLVP